MASSVKRERQLARERYERQQARRQQLAARRRRRQQVGAVVLALALVISGVVALGYFLSGEDEATVGTKGEADSSAGATPSASPTPSPSATDGAGCTYSETGTAASKDVGLPAYDVAKADSYKKPFTATLVTDQGDVTIEMAADKAPCTTNSFRHLATSKYFDGTSCHRLTTANILVLQCGDPTGTGSGGPGYQFAEENLEGATYPKGTVAMANAGPGTNGSQFFLVYADSLSLPPDYTPFGTIVKGLDLLEQVAAAGSDDSNGAGDGKPKLPVQITTLRVAPKA